MTDSYYILQDGVKTGPFTYHELINMGLNTDSRIVSDTGSNWQNASDVPDFDDYFADKGHVFPTEDNLATFWWRLLAYVIDYIVLILIVSIFSFAFGIYIYKNKVTFNPEDPQTKLTLQAIGLLLYIVYNTVFDATPMRGTIGKKMCRLVVVDADGLRLSIGKSFIRNFSKILSSLVFCIGFLNILWDEHRQGWHDQIARTYVLKQQA